MRALKFTTGVVFLVCGCCIYLMYRSKSLNIYQWCAAAGLSDCIDRMRLLAQRWYVPPDFVRFSLPDGLYCAAYILMADAIWHKDDRNIKFCVISLVPIVVIGSEILQYFGVVKGTFDIYDLICYSVPPAVYVCINRRNISRTIIQKNGYE